MKTAIHNLLNRIGQSLVSASLVMIRNDHTRAANVLMNIADVFVGMDSKKVLASQKQKAATDRQHKLYKRRKAAK